MQEVYYCLCLDEQRFNNTCCTGTDSQNIQQRATSTQAAVTDGMSLWQQKSRLFECTDGLQVILPVIILNILSAVLLFIHLCYIHTCSLRHSITDTLSALECIYLNDWTYYSRACITKRVQLKMLIFGLTWLQFTAGDPAFKVNNQPMCEND